MTAVVFDPAAFIVRYPEFAAVDPGLLQQYFNEAGLWLSNTDCPVADIPTRTILFNYLTAHIAVLNGALNPPQEGGAAGVPVGRTSNASEGSVSAGFDYGGQPGSASWYNQTQYGAAYYSAVLPYRSFRYRARPVRPL